MYSSALLSNEKNENDARKYPDYGSKILENVMVKVTQHNSLFSNDFIKYL